MTAQKEISMSMQRVVNDHSLLIYDIKDQLSKNKMNHLLQYITLDFTDHQEKSFNTIVIGIRCTLPLPTSLTKLEE